MTFRPAHTLRTVAVLAAAVCALAATGCGDSSSSSSGAGGAAAGSSAAFDRLAEAVRARVASGRSTGIAAGLLLPDGTTRVVVAGLAGAGRPVTTGTVFEIGSITKVFTATLLADAARRGEVGLDDRVGAHLPGVALPAATGAIRLVDLATHTSGLPHDPGNLPSKDPANPYAGYGPAGLRAFLSRWSPAGGHPGYSYSNVGYGLLGEILAARSGSGYEALLRRRVLAPLGMRHTGIAMTPAMRARLAAGHGLTGSPLPPMEIPGIEGAGALRSTVGDMLRFAAAALGHGPRDLVAALKLSEVPRVPAAPGLRVGLGWHVLAAPGGAITWHNGGTPGFTSFLGLDLRRGMAVIVLTDSSREGADDVGLHALDPAVPLVPAPRARTAVRVPAAVMARHVGVYRVEGARYTVRLGRGGLVLAPSGQAPVPLLALGPDRYFVPGLDLEAEFTQGPDGRTNGVVVRQPDGEVRGTRE